MQLANKLHLFCVCFCVWFRDLISTTRGRLGCTLSNPILSVSHLTIGTHTHTHTSHQAHQFRCFPNPICVMIYVLFCLSHSFFNVSAFICLSLYLCISVSILLLLLLHSIHTSSLTALLFPSSSAWRDFCLLTAYLMFNALWFSPRHLQAWEERGVERRGGRKFDNRVKGRETEEDKGRPQ